MLVTQLCPTLCDPMDYSPPGSSVHGTFQARILEWVAIPFSKGSSRPRDGICLLHCRQIFLPSEPPGKPHFTLLPTMKVSESWGCSGSSSGASPKHTEDEGKIHLEPRSSLLIPCTYYHLEVPGVGDVLHTGNKAGKLDKPLQDARLLSAREAAGQAASISGCLNLPLNCLRATFWETVFLNGKTSHSPIFSFL